MNISKQTIDDEAIRRYPKRYKNNAFRRTAFEEGIEFAALHYSQIIQEKDEEINEYSNNLKNAADINSKLLSELQELKAENERLSKLRWLEYANYLQNISKDDLRKIFDRTASEDFINSGRLGGSFSGLDRVPFVVRESILEFIMKLPALLNSEQGVQVSDTTEAEKSGEAGSKTPNPKTTEQ